MRSERDMPTDQLQAVLHCLQVSLGEAGVIGAHWIGLNTAEAACPSSPLHSWFALGVFCCGRLCNPLPQGCRLSQAEHMLTVLSDDVGRAAAQLGCVPARTAEHCTLLSLSLSPPPLSLPSFSL
jgi:hypothetical protein